MQLSFVIATHNAAGTIEACLDSIGKTIEELNSQDVTSEILVVDTASTDGTADKAAAANVTLVRNTVNIGLAAAINQGVAQSSGEIIITVCPLTGIQSGSVRRLLEYLDTHPTCGIAGAKLLDSKGTTLPMQRKLPNCITKLTKSFGCSCCSPCDQPTEVGQTSFIFAAIRRSVFTTLGPLDERFAATFADTDICRRAQKSLAPKITVAYVPQARAQVLDRFLLHPEPEAASLQGEKVVQNRIHGEMLYMWKHHGMLSSAFFAALEIAGGIARYLWHTVPSIGKKTQKAHACMVIRHTAKAAIDTQLGAQLPVKMESSNTVQ